MATTKHKITAPVKWAKVFEQNRDMDGFEGAARAYDGQYIVNVVLDKATREEFKKSGSAARPNLDKDDDMVVKLKRKHKDRFEESSGAPQVTKADGTVWDYKVDGPIGNNSICEIEYEVYTTKMSNGTRLISLKVIQAEELPPREEPKENPRSVADLPF